MAKTKNPTRWLRLFENFAGELKIASKEVSSADSEGAPFVMWDSQRLFLKNLAAGLEEGVRCFVCGKGRQAGITTVSLMIDVFWMAMFRNTIGALVTDTDLNKEANRQVIGAYIDSLPEGYFGESFAIKYNNNKFLEFTNGSRLDLLVAGKRKNASWGEGRGYSYAHLTECANYADEEGLRSFEEALAQKNPDRLFLYESTGKGYNHWAQKWKAAKNDPHTMRAFFVSWWAVPTNRIEESDARFAKFNYQPNGEESARINSVEAQYGFRIELEQLAWYRWKQSQATADPLTLQQNAPWTEQEMFVLTGHSFFPMRMVGQALQKIEDCEDSYRYDAYRYEIGNDFWGVVLERIVDPKQKHRVQLRVWEEPAPNGKYVIGFDPAWGRTEWKDRHAVSVWRCYADKLVQVAEFATADIEYRHAAWVCAHLAGCYKDCMVNIDLGGPGRTIMDEWEMLKAMCKAEAYQKFVEDRQWQDFLDNARWYLFHRPDSMGAGYAANFECLALDTPLPTPFGWTTMGSVRDGDYLLSEDGVPTEIIALSDIKIGAKCYEITFDDGTVIVSDENHWWKVARRHWWHGADKLRQTKQLEAGKYYIRRGKPLQLPDRELPVDPYILGTWLGDGHSAGARMTCGNRDVDEMVANIEACGQPTRRSPVKGGWDIGLTTGNNAGRGRLVGALRSLDLINNKHIPEIYLRASFEQRLSLLQGLMDTDGSAAGNGGSQCEFITTSNGIAAGFAELLRTMGFKAKKLMLDESAYKGTKCAVRHQFWFTARPEMPVFRLSRKVARVRLAHEGRKRRFEPCHRIVSIREVPSVPVRCVTVDSRSSMFLAGTGMIPTHNCTSRTKIEIMMQIKGAFMADELDIASVPLLREMQIVVQDGNEVGAPESKSEDTKDDRVFAAALAVRAWLNWRRPELIAQGLTVERVRAEEDGLSTPVARNINDMVARFFQKKQEDAEGAEEDTGWRRRHGLG